MMALQAVLAEPVRESELAMWRRLLDPVGCRVEAPLGMDDHELARLVDTADVLLVRRRMIGVELMARAGNLRLIQKIGQLTDNIDLAEAARQGIRVATAINQAWVGVAEHAMLLMLALAKQLPRADAAVRAGANPASRVGEVTTETRYAYNWAGVEPISLLHRRCLGLVGFGEIGQLVAARAQAFGMKVLYHQRRRPVSVDPTAGGVWRPLDELLAAADYVSLHVPYSEETAGLIGYRELSMMKPSAYLINTSRGGVIDQAALVEALARRRIAGAGLDVFHEEPLAADDPLVRLDTVVLTPHIAAVRPETLADPFPEVIANVGELAREAGERRRPRTDV